MLWACTDWQIDWTAVAACIALGIWLLDHIKKERERRRAARSLAQHILLSLQIVSAYLHRMAIDFKSEGSEEERDKFDRRISDDRNFRAALLEYIKCFQLDDIRRLSERADVLPADFSVSLVLFFSEMNSVLEMAKVMGESMHDGTHYENMGELRTSIADAIRYTDRAMNDAMRLSRVPLMLKWRMRLRHGKAN